MEIGARALNASFVGMPLVINVLIEWLHTAGVWVGLYGLIPII